MNECEREVHRFFACIMHYLGCWELTDLDRYSEMQRIAGPLFEARVPGILNGLMRAGRADGYGDADLLDALSDAFSESVSDAVKHLQLSQVTDASLRADTATRRLTLTFHVNLGCGKYRNEVVIPYDAPRSA